MTMFKHILAAALLLPGLALAATPVVAVAAENPALAFKGKPDDLAPPAAQTRPDDWSISKPDDRGKADPKPPKALGA